MEAPSRNFPDELEVWLSEDRPGAIKSIEPILKHYTELFVYQARQRLDAIRFFFVGYALLANGVIQLFEVENYLMGALLAVLSGAVSIIFLRLDYRNAEIVEIIERPLSDLQWFLARAGGGGNIWQTFEGCDSEKHRWTKYGRLAPALFILFWIGSFAATGYLLALHLEKRVAWEGAWIAGAATALGLLIFGVLGSSRKPRVGKAECTETCVPSPAHKSGNGE